MNMKEAFRFQNKLDAVLSDAEVFLDSDRNVTKTELHYLRKKVMSDAEDEVVRETPPTSIGDENITALIHFTMFILAEKETLFRAIRKAKDGQAIDIDSEVSLNKSRQRLSASLRRLAGLRASETVISNGGFGYRFNAEGNQVSYKCDVRKVTTINFDRDEVRGLVKELNARSDSVSADVDRCIVNADVDYAAPFDVNASFGDIFEAWLEMQPN
ncbi:MAG: hypothetical protein IKT07_02420 [Oscillospiraceae bacterium]|nr:hypothetical protein [Oscillospiraceae bacterium]